MKRAEHVTREGFPRRAMHGLLNDAASLPEDPKECLPPLRDLHPQAALPQRPPPSEYDLVSIEPEEVLSMGRLAHIYS